MLSPLEILYEYIVRQSGMNEHSTLKTLILCADDYGQSEPISQGILQLVAKGHLSAVSCMSGMPNWAKYGPLLTPYQNSVEIGLHINLSDGKPLSNPVSLVKNGRYLSYKDFLLKATLDSLDKTEIKTEIHAQLQAFKEVLGFYPHFIDGHRHIHLLPIVQKTLIELYNEHYAQKSAYIRIPSNGWWRSFNHYQSFPKASIIHLLGAKKLRHRLLAEKIPFNPSFSGIYLFRKHDHYQKYFDNFLKQSQDNGIIMCHPGLESKGSSNLLDKARWSEQQFFMQDGFLELLKCRGWQLKTINH